MFVAAVINTFELIGSCSEVAQHEDRGTCRLLWSATSHEWEACCMSRLSSNAAFEVWTLTEGK